MGIDSVSLAIYDERVPRMTRKTHALIKQAILKQQLLAGEKIPDVKELRRLRERPIRNAKAREILDIGPTRMSAIKKVMGISHTRYVFLSDIRQFLRQNPTFSEMQVYPKRSRQEGGGRA